MNDLADDIEPFSTATASTARSSRKRSIPTTSPPSGDVALAPTEQVSVGSRRPVPVSARNELSTRSQLVTAGGRVSGTPKPRSWPGIAMGVRVAVGAGLALAAVATLVAVRALPARSGSSVAQDAAPSEAQTQMSASTEATGEFRAGMLALRDATVGTARTHFDKALKIDPAFAAAHLGRALFETISDGTVMVDLQEHLAGARSGRASLGDRDRALLTGLEPCALAPPDFKESVRRLEEAAKKYPDDAILVFELGFVRRQLGDHEGAAKAFQEALARDPTFATAWRMIAHERIAMDDISGAVQADQECLKIAPSGIACFADLAGIRSHEGKCDGVVEVSRRMLAAMPESDDAYMYLAGGLFGVGEPLGAVRSAFELRWQRVPPDHRRVIEAEDSASLDILAGNFAQAFTDNAEIDAAVASDAQEWGHFRGAYLRMLLDVELGKPAEAVATARDYMTRRSAWSGSSFESGLTMWVQSLEFAAGGIPALEFEKLRERWASEPNAVGEMSPGSVWAVAYAGPVQTKDDAARALAALPTGPLLDMRAQTPDMLQRIGHAYLLGGRVDDAIAALGDAARSCKATRRFEPIFTTWAIYDLGQAFEARGDHDQACDAYTRVLARWGGTRSSLTASRARARARALRCGGGDSSAAGTR
jgi:tetratricopeptide (TPR) repeat protein